MKRWIEATVFTALAVVILVAGFALSPSEGSEAGGVGGDSLISIAAAPPTVAEMVEAWERPVDLQPEPVADLTPTDLAATPLPQAPQFAT